MSLLPERPGFHPRSSHTKDPKMVLDATLLYTQHFKVRIKGKVEQSMEKSSALPYISVLVAIEKGAFGSPSTTVANFTILLVVDISWVGSIASLWLFIGPL